MHDGDTPQDATARGAYTDQVTQLVEAHCAVLFDLVTAAAQRASTGAEPITVTRTAQALTASVGAQAATFQVEAITAHPADLRRAQTYPTGQARCLLPQPDGTTDEWVLALQRVGTGDRGRATSGSMLGHSTPSTRW